MRGRNCCGTVSGICGLNRACTTCKAMANLLSIESYGIRCVIISHNTIPKLYASDFSDMQSPFRTSGAVQSRLPVHSFFFRFLTTEKPKSLLFGNLDQAN
eukprot:TRINITY_DN503_c0_g1_i6.p1 TRINITY_DN503_c0_g1~~TRINITY_DN503_c0_g1_i6.p1  ORF type:complete len:100 (-),score=10.31 TRINITY_DN503_c0_g1_i6:14-313(-)